MLILIFVKKSMWTDVYQSASGNSPKNLSKVLDWWHFDARTVSQNTVLIGFSHPGKFFRDSVSKFTDDQLQVIVHWTIKVVVFLTEES